MPLISLTRRGQRLATQLNQITRSRGNGPSGDSLEPALSFKRGLVPRGVAQQITSLPG